ncbi:MAG: PP2C family protein-serine/threonine phosphatase [Acidobacteria bacterium]|jgi:serine phosphatase RsbU (regulator of sigma subunit)|nr:PP2C family protein-serine/threonine phosphatase [Acidobacteriota bacterium]
MNHTEEKTRFKSIVTIIIFIIAFDYILKTALFIIHGNWTFLWGRFITLLLIFTAAYLYRDQLTQWWENLKKQGRNVRQDFENSGGNAGIKDAAIFSLIWSKEIYQNIPADRKNLVKTSFILIGLAVIILILQFNDLFSLIIAPLLIFAGVNLLIWGVGREREEQDRIRFELETARKMQISLMPTQDPTVQGFDISGCCLPAQDVGGDLFDYLWPDKNGQTLCITVVDVSGKGMDAALTAVYTSGALVSESQHEEDIVKVIRNLNTAIYSRQNRSRFVSIFMASLDVASRRVRCVNAGQSRPLLLRGNDVSVLQTPGARFPLGVMEAPVYQAIDIQLNPGDSLLLYTDGVTEAMNDDEEMFGDERLKTIFQNLAFKYTRSVDIVNALKEEIINFSGSARQHDDLTIVIVKAA